MVCPITQPNFYSKLAALLASRKGRACVQPRVAACSKAIHRARCIQGINLGRVEDPASASCEVAKPLRAQRHPMKAPHVQVTALAQLANLLVLPFGDSDAQTGHPSGVGRPRPRIDGSLPPPGER